MSAFLCASMLAAAALALGAGAPVPHAPAIRLHNGVQMPFLAAGTWQYDDDQAEASILAAFKVGFRMVDTAYDYQNQVGVGRALQQSGLPRSRIFLETKVPGCGADPAVSMWDCYGDTKKVLEKNLQLLNQPYVDLVIIHFPPLFSMLTRTCSMVCGQVQDQWRALEEFYDAGKAKAIGVSNYCPSCFACLDQTAKVYPMVNQVQYHVGMGPDPAGFKSFAEKRGVVLQAYSPLGNSPTHQGPSPEILSGNLTTSLAKAHGKSTVQVALKWLVQHGVPTVTKSLNSTHLAEDLDLWSWSLTDAEMQDADAYKTSGSPSFECDLEKAEEHEEEEVHV